jgi:hypothetical protein
MISAEFMAKKQQNNQKQDVKNWWKADWSSMQRDMGDTDWSVLENLTAEQA